MASRLLTVLPWPGSAPLLRSVSQAQSGLLIIGLVTPQTANRSFARERVRIAVREALGILLECPPKAIELISQPGQPMRVELPGQRIGLSVSHEPGLTLAAICLRDRVGIDLVRIEHRADWEQVARDYLGAQARVRIALSSPKLRPYVFAREWTRLEACLKCHGLALTEWHPKLENDMMRCCMSGLNLPEGLVGTVATCF